VAAPKKKNNNKEDVGRRDRTRKGKGETRRKRSRSYSLSSSDESRSVVECRILKIDVTNRTTPFVDGGDGGGCDNDDIGN